MINEDLSGQPPSQKDLAEAVAVIRKYIVRGLLTLPPELAVQLPNILRCLETARPSSDGHWTREPPTAPGAWILHSDSHPPEGPVDLWVLDQNDLNEGWVRDAQAWWWSVPMPPLPPLPKERP